MVVRFIPFNIKSRRRLSNIQLQTALLIECGEQLLISAPALEHSSVSCSASAENRVHGYAANRYQ